MPIVKKDRAEFDSQSLVSLADYTLGGFGPASALVSDKSDESAASDEHSPEMTAEGSAAHHHTDPEIELVRNGSGDIIRIDVRCECGHTTSLHCEYESQ